MNPPGAMPLEDRLDNEQHEYHRMILALELYDPPDDIAAAIREAYDHPVWDWRLCDGCTAVSEVHSPVGLRFWPCVRHDYDCWRASLAPTKKIRNEWRDAGDAMFYRSQVAFGVHPVRARLRWLGVRGYWNFKGRWLSLQEAHHVHASGCSRCRGL